ncbi:MAG: thioredoxin family protein [Planctomycetes bacterium]|nr:thioredoxin family protein [Planctomycetota bacterium]
MLRLTACFTVLALCLIPVSTRADGQEIQWLQSIDQARQIAGQTNRLVLVHFWSNDCQPCMRMEQSVYSRPGTAQRIQAKFVPVKVNAQQFPAVARQYEVTSWPSDVILAPNGQVVALLRCSLDQAAYLAGLEQVAVTADPRLNNPYANLNAVAGSAPSAAPSVAAQQPTVTPGQAPTGNVEDRYAEYFRDRSQGASPNAIPQSPIAQQPPTVQVPATPQLPQSKMQPPVASMPVPTGQNPYAALLTGQPAAPVAPAPMANNAAVTPPAVNLPTAAPQAPLALEGHCAVELVEHERWVRGDRRFGAVHRGQTYLFTGAEQQKRFLANPDYYGPAMSGVDPVLALEARQMTPGLRKHGLFYNNRVYLFSSEATLAQFCRTPARYADGVRFAETASGAALR